ncbi:hypothetical protein F442_14842 [Phytophthora nicotianae P10297]|uniref:Uncharacterized protein n=1 Tax=Phytophthora nicotianae P10297 TaxID=1317064 RepID=W2YR99_PHYNI|nr:hypothetical protein F442_14842 [Phytophthora nicotianae P10297]
MEYEFEEAIETSQTGDRAAITHACSTVSVFDTFNAARTAIIDQSDNIYTYETRYETDRILTRVYRCRSHERSEHRFKVKELRYQGVPTTYQLEDSGQHGAIGISVQRRGIKPLLVEEIDSLLRVGWGSSPASVYSVAQI